jgi:hypothetical protein
LKISLLEHYIYMTVPTVPVSPIGTVIAQALRDPALRAKLLTEPKQTLLAMNVPIPADQAVTVLESDGACSFFVVPVMTPADVQELKDSLGAVQNSRSARSRVLIKAAEDPDYKMQLMQDPKAVLQAAGINIPDPINITILENSAEQLHIVIPAIPHHH